jgi:hypothetical protein
VVTDGELRPAVSKSLAVPESSAFGDNGI